MSKISTYTTVTPAAGDKVIGTDVAGSPTNATKNFRVEDIAALAGSQALVNLSQVLSAGNTATNNISLTGNLGATGSVLLGTAGGATVASNALFSASGGIVVPSGQQAQFQSGSELTAVLPSHDDNTAATAAGLAVGRLYRTTGSGAAPLDTAGIVMVVV